MQVSPARLNTVRVALGVFIIFSLFWGIGGLFFPKGLIESMAPKEPFTPFLQAVALATGAFAWGWVVMAAIAVANPVRNRGLIQAIIATSVIFFIVEVYIGIAVFPFVAASLVSDAVLIILAVVMAVAYPWGQETT